VSEPIGAMAVLKRYEETVTPSCPVDETTTALLA
jgi:hypothetical protein